MYVVVSSSNWRKRIRMYIFREYDDIALPPSDDKEPVYDYVRDEKIGLKAPQEEQEDINLNHENPYAELGSYYYWQQSLLTVIQL